MYVLESNLNLYISIFKKAIKSNGEIW
jgi:hypothetical protein